MASRSLSAVFVVFMALYLGYGYSQLVFHHFALDQVFPGPGGPAFHVLNGQGVGVRGPVCKIGPVPDGPDTVAVFVRVCLLERKINLEAEIPDQASAEALDQFVVPPGLFWLSNLITVPSSATRSVGEL